MSPMPLPSGLSDLLKPGASANLSLVFDRGMDRYQDRTFSIPTGGKEAFLKDFCADYKRRPNPDFSDFQARRSAALEATGAEAVEMTTHARLVIGLGLPHPIETGFLFDRLTGSVYLPGSSVKGVMRAAARMVSDDPDGFWSKENIDRLFGPPIAPGTTPRTGSLRVYDAFPARWPLLEVDFLTPHFSRYYDRKGVPADWESPTPVPFLTVAEGQVFRFHFSSSDAENWKEDCEQLKTLLRTALEWLGIGGKTSSGYGQMKEGPLPERPGPLPPEPPEKEKKGGGTEWMNVQLQLHRSVPTAFRGKNQSASCREEELDPELLRVLRQSRNGVRANVEVLSIHGGFRIVKVLKWT